APVRWEQAEEREGALGLPRTGFADDREHLTGVDVIGDIDRSRDPAVLDKEVDLEVPDGEDRFPAVQGGGRGAVGGAHSAFPFWWRFCVGETILPWVIRICSKPHSLSTSQRCSRGWCCSPRSSSSPTTCASSTGPCRSCWQRRSSYGSGSATRGERRPTAASPWAGADARWNLRIDTRSGSYTSWALPAGSGTARRLPNRREEASMTQRQLRGNTAEAAAVIIGERVTALTEAGHLGSPTLGDVEVDVSINPAAVISAAAVAACVVIALV